MSNDKIGTWHLSAILIFAVIFSGIAIIFYWQHFGYAPSNITKDITKWGATGDFFGGVLNPIFGFLGLFALLLTLLQTEKALRQNEKILKLTQEELLNSQEELKRSADAAEKQLYHFKQESKKDELQRIIAIVSDEIKQVLNSKVTSEELLTKLSLTETTINYYLESLTNHLLNEGINNEYYKLASKRMNPAFKKLSFKLADLSRFLNEYMLVTNNYKSALTEYYIVKYNDVSTRLLLNNYINDDISKVFSLDKDRADLITSLKDGW